MRSLLAVGCSSFALLVAPAAWAQGWGAQGGVSTGGGGSYSYSGPAVGDTHANFGLANQFVLSTNLDVGFVYTARSGGDPPLDQSTSDFSVLFGTNIGRLWALDYFVIDNLSIGGQVEYTTRNDGDDSVFSIAPRVGYNIAFSDDFSIWPQAGVTFSSEKGTGDVAGAPVETTERAFGLFLNAPILYHITNHFFLGAGPFINTELSHSAEAEGGDSADLPKTTNVGIQSVLGGYL
ncbi:MAG TPA: hypothetical protein VFS43_22080 [Polyangiaceae bacterium]|nr:hypothetical protein [Polyangiaceae bacterium]